MKASRFKLFMMACACAALSACASVLSTPYQEFGSGGAEGGYKDKSLGNGCFEIACYGNGYTSYDTLEMHFHRRASELAKGRPYEFKTERATETLKVEEPATKTLKEYSLPVVKGTVSVAP